MLSGAALVIELKKRLMMLVYDDYKDEAAALVQPLVSAASNDMLEAAAEAVEAIYKDLGMGASSAWASIASSLSSRATS